MKQSVELVDLVQQGNRDFNEKDSKTNVLESFFVETDKVMI